MVIYFQPIMTPATPTDEEYVQTIVAVFLGYSGIRFFLYFMLGGGEPFFYGELPHPSKYVICSVLIAVVGFIWAAIDASDVDILKVVSPLFILPILIYSFVDVYRFYQLATHYVSTYDGKTYTHELGDFSQLILYVDMAILGLLSISAVVYGLGNIDFKRSDVDAEIKRVRRNKQKSEA